MTIARYYNRKLRQRIMDGDEPAWLKIHIRRDYIIRCLYSFVPWADVKKLRRMSAEAKRRGMVLDHIIPVTHPYVCGLTIPENMRIVSKEVNAAKSNKWHPDQMALRIEHEPEPHQLRLTLGGRIAA